MVSEKSVDCDIIILDTTGEKMNAFILEAIQKFDADEELQFLLADSIADVFQLLKAKGYEEIITSAMSNDMMTMDGEDFHFPDRLEIKDAIEDASANILLFMENIKFAENFKILLYVDSKENIIKYEVEGVVEAGGNQVSFEIDSTDHKTSDNYSEKSFDLYIEPRGEGVSSEDHLQISAAFLGTPINDNEIIYEANGNAELLQDSKKMFDANFLFKASVKEENDSKTINVEKGSLSIKESMYNNGELDEALLININKFTSIHQREESEEKKSLEFDFSIVAGDELDLNLNGSINDVVTKKDETDSYERNIGFDLLGTFISDGTEFELDLGTDINGVFDFEKESSIPVYSEADYIDIGGLDEFEFEALKNEIMGNIFGLVFGGTGGFGVY